MNELIHILTQPVFSDPHLVRSEIVTVTLAVITAVTSILKGVNFTRTPHLSFDMAAQQAESIRPAFAAQFIKEKGISEKTISEQAIKVVNYLRARNGQQSWQINSGTFANDIQNAIARGDYRSNPENFVQYVSNVWLIYVLMNYDAKRPDDFAEQLVARTREVWGIDLSKPSATTTAGAVKQTVTGAIDTLVGGVKTLFGVEDATAADGTQSQGISQSTILLGLGLVLLLIFIFRSK